jgi:hypothetical protein
MDADSPRDVVVGFLRGPAEPNVGGLDRVWRSVVGPLLLVGVATVVAGLVELTSGPVAVVLLAASVVVGAIVTHSAATRRCRVNHLAGVDTSEE